MKLTLWSFASTVVVGWAAFNMLSSPTREGVPVRNLVLTHEVSARQFALQRGENVLYAAGLTENLVEQLVNPPPNMPISSFDLAQVGTPEQPRVQLARN